MKKTYKTIKLFLVLLSFAVIKLGAQPMNGLYTINSGAATAGTNFQTFTAFATMINSVGINAAVTVDVVPGSGPYNEQCTINQISGMGSGARVTIEGNGNLLIFNSTNSGAPHTLLLNGTDYLTVNNLNVEGQGATYAMPVVLANGANYNSFNNGIYTCPLNGTSSYHCPFTIGNPTSPTGGGAAGDYNTVTSCTMANGYYGFVSYGVTGSPWTKFNSVVNCKITDWYLYGPYFYYNQNFTMKGCIIDRNTRTTTSTTYAMYAAYNNNCVLDGNRIEKLFNGTPGNSSAIYFYMYYEAQPGVGRNIMRNNIITDIKTNGTMYMYQYYGAWDIYHNTFDWDYAGSTGGTLYNCYAYSNSSYGPINIYNNIITMRRAGTKYGIYTGGTLGFTNIDRNDIVVTGAGTNYIGYYSSAALNQAAWQAQGCDVTGFNVDPLYVNQTNGDLHPAEPTINNQGIPYGVQFDQQNAVRNPTTPDIGALEFLTPLCTGTPSSTVAGPNFLLCPGETASFGIGNLSADAGYTYQWATSTISQVGPWTTINGANSINYTSGPNNSPNWVSCVISCTAPGGTSIQPVAQVSLAGVTTNTAPYFDGFETIGLNGRLPNCSWSSNVSKTYVSAQNGNRLPRTGTSFGTFESAPAGVNYYYTNSIYMKAGITYSASVWYMTDFTGSTNFTDLSLLIGTSQSSVGLVPIASTNGPAVSPIYKSLSNTYSVATSGFYNVAIRSTASAVGALYLTFDDLRIEIPCTPTINTPSVTLTAGSGTNVCAGVALNLTANGANTYLWSTGSTAAAITVTPSSNGTYYVVGTSTLSGCAATVTQAINVKPSPVVSIINLPTTACAGKPINLIASGASNYVWNTGAVGNVVSVSPNASITYTVIGTNAQGCSSQATQFVTVFPNPLVTANANRNTICAGESEQLNGAGALNYQWMSNSIFIQGNPVSVSPQVSTTYTVMGTDANGCTNTDVFNMTVNACTGINVNASNVANLSVYPNPTKGEFVVNLNNTSLATVQVLDMTGRVIASYNNVNESVNVNLTAFASGIYYVKVSSANVSGVIKIVKD